MDINNVKAFLSVAKHGSFSKAAEELHVTQSAISKRIANLETELNAKLFTRSHNILKLTDLGNMFMPFAIDASHALDTAQKRLDSFKKKEREPITIGVGYFIGLYCIPDILIDFTQNVSEIDLSIRYLVPYMMIEALQNKEVEFCVNTFDKKYLKDFVALPLWRYRRSIAVAKKHPLALIENPSLEQITEYPAILLPKHSPSRQMTDEYFKKRKIKLHAKYEAGIIDTVRNLCRNGHGWAILENEVITDDLKIIYQDDKFYLDYYLVYNKDHKFSSSVNKLVELIKQTATLEQNKDN